MTHLILNEDYEIIKYGRKYLLLKEQTYKTDIKFPRVDHKYFTIYPSGKIVARAGYAWDGASGGVDTANFMRGSLFHDVLCQAIEEKLLPASYRKAADKMLYKILGEDGMLGIRRLWVYNAIRLYVRIAY